MDFYYSNSEENQTLNGTLLLLQVLQVLGGRTPPFQKLHSSGSLYHCPVLRRTPTVFTPAHAVAAAAVMYIFAACRCFFILFFIPTLSRDALTDKPRLPKGPASARANSTNVPNFAWHFIPDCNRILPCLAEHRRSYPVPCSSSERATHSSSVSPHSHCEIQCADGRS